MKKRIVVGLIITLILVLAGCSTSRPQTIGVMDMELVLKKSQRAGELQQELMAIGNELEEEYNQKKEELPAEKGEEELDKIYQEYLDNKERLENKLNQEINRVITEISREQDIDIVISSDQVYFGGVDITEEVIKRLDKGPEKGGESDAE
ncbi:MAG: hypothetical protein PWR10_713 [Halanaerobiales bacterium]|nr:hypothetical protein [Halanaerobiales bacterium]